jgi:SAM-dependent methyltransferase
LHQRPSIARRIKQSLLTGPALMRDSRVLRGAFRLREAAIAAVGRRRGAAFTAPDGLPIPPARLRVAVSGIADPGDHIKAGEESAAAIRTILDAAGLRIEEFGSILDFGCGSGRVIRRWAGLEGVEVFGSDYNADAISWCVDNLPFARFEPNNLEPPTSFPSQRFGFVYALSVFTHLPERLQRPWIEELRRVLRPGGHLLITVAGESFRHHLSARDATRFGDGELVVHFPRSAGMNMCAVYHPPGYVRALLSGGFELVHSIPAGNGAPYPQDMYLARAICHPDASPPNPQTGAREEAE